MYFIWKVWSVAKCSQKLIGMEVLLPSATPFLKCLETKWALTLQSDFCIYAILIPEVEWLCPKQLGRTLEKSLNLWSQFSLEPTYLVSNALVLTRKGPSGPC